MPKPEFMKYDNNSIENAWTVSFKKKTNELSLNSNIPIIFQAKDGQDIPANQYPKEQAAIYAIMSIPQVKQYINEEYQHFQTKSNHIQWRQNKKIESLKTFTYSSEIYLH